MNSKPNKPSYLLKTLMISPLANITYLLFDQQSKQCALIDSPWDIDQVLGTVESSGYKLTSVFMTHTHLDHIKDLTELFHLKASENDKLNIYISKTEAEFWGGEFDQLPAKKKIYLKDQQNFYFGKTQVKALLSPGHTPGSICYLLDQDIIVGDVLFTYGCGRVDLWGCGRCKEKNQFINNENCGRCAKKSGDVKLLYQSLQNLKKWVGDDIQVRCGHFYGEKEFVSMKEQKNNNSYLLAQDFTQFCHLRLK